MKKMLMVGLVLALVLSMCARAEVYGMMTVVVELDRVNDEVVCVDFNGNLWAFGGCEDWCVGDIYVMLMDDCGTLSIYDDVIVSVQYEGWIEGWIDRLCVN